MEWGSWRQNLAHRKLTRVNVSVALGSGWARGGFVLVEKGRIGQH